MEVHLQGGNIRLAQREMALYRLCLHPRSWLSALCCGTYNERRDRQSCTCWLGLGDEWHIGHHARLAWKCGAKRSKWSWLDLLPNTRSKREDCCVGSRQSRGWPDLLPGYYCFSIEHCLGSLHVEREGWSIIHLVFFLSPCAFVYPWWDDFCPLVGKKQGVCVLYLEVVSLTGMCLTFLVSWRSWLKNRGADRAVRG